MIGGGSQAPAVRAAPAAAAAPAEADPSPSRVTAAPAEVRERLPLPTPRALQLLALGLAPAMLAGAMPWLLGWLLAFDLLVVVACGLDLVLARRRRLPAVKREAPARLTVGTRESIQLVLHGEAPCKGTLRDAPDPRLESDGHLQHFEIPRGGTALSMRLLATTRGRFRLGPLHLRVQGPLGLVQRRAEVADTLELEAWPDLGALSRDALALVHGSRGEARRRALRPEDGREFHSLRTYRPGEDARGIDWKATARRDVPVVRVLRPEQHQPVLLLLDCGRHMSGLSGGRRRLDLAVEAALKLAAAGLAAGDRVGLLCYDDRIRVHLPPRGGREHLRSLAGALLHLEAGYAESDPGLALQTALRDLQRRALVVVFTDLVDAESARPILDHLARLRPRHLPLLATLEDVPLTRRASEVPRDVAGAYERHAAQRLDEGLRRALGQLRLQGARVVHEPPERFGPGSVNAYLELKARGAI